MPRLPIRARASTSWLTCLLSIALLTLFATSAAIAQTGDNRSYCKSDGRIALFLIDITTPYDQTDKDIIVKATDKILASLYGGEKIIIRTITDSRTHSEQLIERCIPYCAAEGFSRIFLCNDGAIRTDREGVYADIVESLRQRLAKFEETRHSDIVRTVVLAAKEDGVEGRPLSLYIYSDLIENSDYLSGRKFFSNPCRSADRSVAKRQIDCAAQERKRTSRWRRSRGDQRSPSAGGRRAAESDGVLDSILQGIRGQLG
jgi:hypothetical protein